MSRSSVRYHYETIEELSEMPDDAEQRPPLALDWEDHPQARPVGELVCVD